MTVSTLFGQSGTGVPSGVTADNSDYTMGVQFTVSVSGTLTGIWFYSAPSAITLPDVIALYQVSGTSLVHSETPAWSGLAGSGWVWSAFSSPPALTASTSYKACVFNDGGSNWYSHTPSYWSSGPGTSGISSGPLSAPNNAGADGGQDSFTQTTSLAYPSSSFSAANYWVDPEVTTAGGSTVNGAAALAASPVLTAPAVLLRLGQAPLAAVPSLAAAAVLSRLGHVALISAPALTVQGGRGVPAHAALSSSPALAASAGGSVRLAQASLAAVPILLASGQAGINPELLWEAYMLAADTARAAEFSWRMQRSAGGASGQTGFLFQAFYEADAAAGQAYEAWRAAYRSINPGARG